MRLVASGVELDLLRRVQALEQQVQQLSTTQRDETLQPTNITINPTTGAVSALFTGGVQITAGQLLAWLNAAGAVVADITSDSSGNLTLSGGTLNIPLTGNVTIPAGDAIAWLSSGGGVVAEITSDNAGNLTLAGSSLTVPELTGGIQIPAGQELAWLNALGATVADITSDASGNLTLAGSSLTVPKLVGVLYALGLVIASGVNAQGPANEITWERASDNAMVGQVGSYQSPASGNYTRTVLAAGNPDATGSGSNLSIQGNVSPPGGGSNWIRAISGSALVTILNDAGDSTFLQIGSAILSKAGTTAMTFPGGTYTAYVNVFLPGASGTVYGVATATNRSDGGGAVMTSVTPLGGGGVQIGVLAPSQVGVPGYGVTVTVSYIIWGS